MRFAGSVLSHGILDEWYENCAYQIFRANESGVLDNHQFIGFMFLRHSS